VPIEIVEQIELLLKVKTYGMNLDSEEQWETE